MGKGVRGSGCEPKRVGGKEGKRKENKEKL